MRAGETTKVGNRAVSVMSRPDTPEPARRRPCGRENDGRPRVISAASALDEAGHRRAVRAGSWTERAEQAPHGMGLGHHAYDPARPGTTGTDEDHDRRSPAGTRGQQGGGTPATAAVAGAHGAEPLQHPGAPERACRQ